MKKLILFLTALQLACTAHAATYYKVTLTVTSVPPVSAALSGDGDLRQVTNSTPANAGKFWQSTNTLQAVTTNLWQHLQTYNFTNQLAVKLGTNDAASPTNTVVIELTPDRFVSFTSLSNWVTITYSTNTTASGWIGVRVPVANEVATVQTQVVSGLVAALNMAQATNTVSNAAPAMANFISTKTNAQAVTNLSTSGGTHSGGTLTNTLAQRLKLGYGGTTISNNGIWFLSHPTNALGVVVIAPGSGGYPSMYWITNSAPADFSSTYEAEYLLNMVTAAKMFASLTELYAGKTNLHQVINWFTNAGNRWVNGSVSNAALLSGTINGDWVIGDGEIYVTNNVWVIGEDAVFYSLDGTRTFNFNGYQGTAGLTDYSVMTFTDLDPATFDYSSDSSNGVHLASGVHIENPYIFGHTTNAGATINTPGTITTLASGNNLIIRQTNGFTYFSTASGAPTLVGITNGFGTGDQFEALNNSGYPMTVAHESGVAPIATTRITIGDGTTTSVVVSNGGWMKFAYDGSTTRWRLLYPPPPAVINATATNTVVFTNDVSAGSGVLNFIGATVTNYNGTNFVVITGGSGSTNFIRELTVISTNASYPALLATNAIGQTQHVVRVLGTNGSAGLVVDAQGKVGVGTNAPARTLDVAGTIVVGSGSVTQPGYSFGALTNYGIFASTGPNRINVAVAGFDMFSVRSDNSMAEVRSTGGFAWSSAADTTSTPDVTLYRAGAGTNGIGTSASTPAGSLLASNLALRGQIEITQTTTTNSPSTDSVRLWAANNGGTAELIAEDEAGNVVQLTSHPADAPEAFYIVTNWTRALPRISKTVNRYLGVVEWNNDTLAMLLRKWELKGTNIAGLPQPLRRALADALHEEETFAEYTARTGEVLVQADWTAQQNERQASWNAARLKEIEEFNTPMVVTNAQGAVLVLTNNPNVTVRADRDIRKPQPDRLRERVEQSRGKGKRN